MRSISLLLTSMLSAALVAAHGSHMPDIDTSHLPWAERHLLSEHHITNYDAGAFFSLHDFDQNLYLDKDEVVRMYGLEPSAGVPDHAGPFTDVDKAKVWNAIQKLMDFDGNGVISQAEWMRWSREGGQLPDLGYGPGHHGDAEYEYEIHHFERYHGGEDEGQNGENMVLHKEDMEHFALHEEEEKRAKQEAIEDQQPIIERNIPLKYLVNRK